MISLLTEQDRAKAKAIVHCLFNDPQCSQSLQVDAGAAIQNLLSTLKATDALRQQDLARMARMREALNHVDSYLDDVPHGENCFVSNHYEGDPGNRCNCGKDAVCQNVDEALSETSDVQVWMDGQRATVPEGWQLVPKMPTKEMWEAGYDCDALEIELTYYVISHIYQAMLAAAPSARSTKGEG